MENSTCGQKCGTLTKTSSFTVFFPFRWTSLWYNFHTVKYSHFKCGVQWVLTNSYTHIALFPSSQSRFRIFALPQIVPSWPFAAPFPSLGPGQPLGSSPSAFFLPTWRHLCILDGRVRVRAFQPTVSEAHPYRWTVQWRGPFSRWEMWRCVDTSHEGGPFLALLRISGWYPRSCCEHLCASSSVDFFFFSFLWG